MHFNFSGDLNRLLALLAKNPVSHIEISEANLEALFMSYYREEDTNA